MHALIYTQTGELAVQAVATPQPKRDQVQIAVRACALNIGDYQRFIAKNGQIPTATKLTNKLMGYVGKPLGAEVAGVVTAPAGGLAECAILDAARVYQKPANLSFEEASCISISFEAALGAMRKAKVKPGQDVMVYGASGGVGLYAVRLARRMAPRLPACAAHATLSWRRRRDVSRSSTVESIIKCNKTTTSPCLSAFSM